MTEGKSATLRVAVIAAGITLGAAVLVVMAFLAFSRQGGEPASAEGTAVSVPAAAARIPTQIEYHDGLAFFDPTNGEAAVWYYRRSDGGYDLFDASGFHPDFGRDAPLQAVNPLVAGDIRLSFEKAKPASVPFRRVAPPRPPQTTVPRESAAPVAATPISPPPAVPDVLIVRSVLIQTGTRLDVVLDRQLSTETNKAGDTFPVTLARSVVVDGQTVLEQGLRLTGEITALERPGQVSGVAKMMLILQSVNGASVETAPLSFEGKATKGKDVAKVGIGAGIGAAVGALFGGKKGAAKGTAVGAGGGAGVVLATRGEELVLAPEQELTFILSRDMTVQK